jgi:BMFP domain-containing protein YqiC
MTLEKAIDAVHNHASKVTKASEAPKVQEVQEVQEVLDLRQAFDVQYETPKERRSTLEELSTKLANLEDFVKYMDRDMNDLKRVLEIVLGSYHLTLSRVNKIAEANGNGTDPSN